MKLPSFLLSLLCTSCLFAQDEIKTLAIGDAAPDFALPGVDGKEHRLSDFANAKVLVVAFTCNHCPDARAAQNKFKAIYTDYKDKGAALVCISGNDPLALRLDEISYSVYGDSFDEMKLLASEENFEFPYLYDGETQSVTLAYGAVATPHVFVFDHERKLCYQGRLDEARRSRENIGTPYVREAIESLLTGQKPATETTRPFGCSTKWSSKRGSVVQDDANWLNRPVSLALLDAEVAESLRENKTDKLRVINFWSTTCGPCVAEFPDLVDASRRFQNRRFELITISTDPPTDQAKVEAFLKKQQAATAPNTEKALRAEGRLSNNYLYHGDNLDHLAEAIDAEWNGALPHTIIIAPGGEVLWRHTGQFKPAELRSAIVNGLEKIGAE